MEKEKVKLKSKTWYIKPSNVKRIMYECADRGLTQSALINEMVDQYFERKEK